MVATALSGSLASLASPAMYRTSPCARAVVLMHVIPGCCPRLAVWLAPLSAAASSRLLGTFSPPLPKGKSRIQAPPFAISAPLEKNNVKTSVLAVCSTDCLQIHLISVGQLKNSATTAPNRALRGVHKGAVTDITFVPSEPTKIYSCCTNMMVARWNISTGVCEAKFKCGTASAPTKIAVSRDGLHLAVADSEVCVYSTASNGLLYRFASHASSVAHLALTGAGSSLCVISSEQNDTFVSVHCVTTRSALPSLVLENPLVALSCSSTAVAALGSDGTISLWATNMPDTESSSTTVHGSNKRAKKATRSPEATVSVVVFTTPLDSSRRCSPRIAVTSLCLADNDGSGHLALTWGGPQAPNFELLATSDQTTGALLPSQKLVRAAGAAFAIAEEDDEKLAGRSGTAVAGQGNGAEDNACLSEDEQDEEKQHVETIGEKLARQGIFDSPADAAAAAAAAGNFAFTGAAAVAAEPAYVALGSEETPLLDTTVSEEFTAAGAVLSGMRDARAAQTRDVGSQHVVLAQALHSGDDALLESVLSSTTSRNSIACTVQRMPQVNVVALLDALIKRIERRPTRAPQMLEWVRAIIATHCGYILTVPDVVQRLSAFYHYLESRLENHSKLQKLQGRLELVIRQSETGVGLCANGVEGFGDARVVVHEDENDEDATYEDMSYPSSAKGSTLRHVNRRATVSALERLGAEINGHQGPSKPMANSDGDSSEEDDSEKDDHQDQQQQDELMDL